MLGGELLPNLHAAAVPMHIAEAADIHQNVEAELLSSAKRTQHFIVLAAVLEPNVDNVTANGFWCSLHCLTNLAIGIMTVFVDQSGRQLDLQRLFIEQINQRRICNRHIAD